MAIAGQRASRQSDSAVRSSRSGVPRHRAPIRRFTLASLALLSLSALTEPVLGQQNRTYTTTYRADTGRSALLIGETLAQFRDSLRRTWGQGLRALDISAYRDQNGALRIDTVYEAAGGSQIIDYDLTESELRM